MRKQIPYTWEQRRASHASTLSSVQTVRETIKQTLMSAPSGDTNSTMVSIAVNNNNYMKIGVNQFTQL